MQEINDKNLEGVSGGSEGNADMRAAAKRICAKCKQEAPGACGGGSPEKLAKQLSASVTNPGNFNYRQCPYFQRGG